jgi:hypothetical protein
MRVFIAQAITPPPRNLACYLSLGTDFPEQILAELENACTPIKKKAKQDGSCCAHHQFHFKENFVCRISRRN